MEFKISNFCRINGPGAVLFTYLTELHGPKNRPRVLMVLGMVQSLGTLMLPILAWLIFPRDWEFILFDSFNGKLW